MPSKPDEQQLVAKVQQSLLKLGFLDCDVRGIHDECLTLHCPAADRDDQCLIQVAIRLMPGISSVVFEPTKNGRGQ